jgi:hypothetical protein
MLKNSDFMIVSSIILIKGFTPFLLNEQAASGKVAFFDWERSYDFSKVKH